MVAEKTAHKPELLHRVLSSLFLALTASLGFVQIPIEVAGQRVGVTDLIFLLLVAVWLASVATKSRQLIWHEFNWLLVFYLAALLVSSIFSETPVRSFSKLPAEIYLVLLSVVSFNVIRTDLDLKRTLLAWCSGAAFASAVGLLSIALFYAAPENPLLDWLTYHYGAAPVGYYPRITSTFPSASMFCNYLNVSILIVLVCARKQWLNRLAANLLLAALLFCSVFTVSIGLGGVFLGLGLWLWNSGRPYRLSKVILWSAMLIAVIFLIASLFALRPYLNAEIWVTIGGIDLMPSSRWLVWRDAIAVFLADPLTGRGLGLPVANVHFTNTDGTTSLLTDAHNVFLSVAAQNGIWGLAALILIILFVLRSWKRSKPLIVLFALGTAFLCSFVYQGITGSFEDARHLWALIGLTIAARRVESRISDIARPERLE